MLAISRLTFVSKNILTSLKYLMILCIVVDQFYFLGTVVAASSHGHYLGDQDRRGRGWPGIV